ncbi:MAG: hypothetical protein CMH66_10490 [Nioella sp.]|nr:hypothetical protein [Nioella sp.]
MRKDCSVTLDVKLSREAEQDIIDIYLYTLTQFGAAKTEVYIDDIYDRFETLAESPSRGTTGAGDWRYPARPAARQSGQSRHLLQTDRRRHSDPANIASEDGPRAPFR